MYEEVENDIFRIPVPLPGNPLKELNAYLVRGEERHLLIDSGFNMPASKAALSEALNHLGVRATDLDFLATHLHADHSGLIPEFAQSPQARFFASACDAEYINNMTRGGAFWTPYLAEMTEHGISDEELVEISQKHPAVIYGPSRPLAFTTVAEGAELRYGGYVFLVLDTPGHTPGHICLYEAAHRLLIAADHILGDITPNIAYWPGVVDSLGSYLRSLDKVDALPVDLTLPGHRSLVYHTQERIEELKAHHFARLNEIRAILGHKAMTAYEVAARMSWSMRGKVWKEFPVAQKWFASGEALAHLDHLAQFGQVSARREGKLTLYQARPAYRV